ncbi:MAG: hypothetical protein ACE5KM_10490, partial [Planctomycetaceae bacterium]
MRATVASPPNVITARAIFYTMRRVDDKADRRQYVERLKDRARRQRTIFQLVPKLCLETPFPEAPIPVP